MQRRDAQFWIDHLGLQHHPEGGYFKESFRSAYAIQGAAIGDRYEGNRVHSTAIYFLVTADRASRLHRLQTDEIWHFYAGDSLEICCIDPAGVLEIKRLGSDIGKGDALQVLVPAGVWFGARVQAGSEYVLCGCTMAPGFEFADFEMGDRKALLKQFPQLEAIVIELSGAE